MHWQKNYGPVTLLYDLVCFFWVTHNVNTPLCFFQGIEDLEVYLKPEERKELTAECLDENKTVDVKLIKVNTFTFILVLDKNMRKNNSYLMNMTTNIFILSKTHSMS